MRFGIRLRFALWLVAALLPVIVASTYVFGQIEAGVSERVGANLEGMRDLQAARVRGALEDYRIQAWNLASDRDVRVLMTEVDGPDSSTSAESFQRLAEALQSKTDATTGQVAALQVVGRNGQVLGESEGFDWKPADAEIIARAMETGTALIGDAFRDSQGHDRIGLVAPILSAENEVVGALAFENTLDPIVRLVVGHESFGETGEAHLAQRTANGDAQIITTLRFESQAAFNKVVPARQNLPINQSLDAAEGRLIYAKDYRGEASILAVQTIEPTGWGLVVKIDRAEALSPIVDRTAALKAVAALGGIGILVGWALLLDPVARRLRRLADGAGRVASGDYLTPLDDRSHDEISDVAKSIDRLATDLCADRAVRTDIEARLRHEATHDATTGLLNRQYATGLMHELAARCERYDDANGFSLLFLDLDEFKCINDSHGHAAGDTVLATTGDRLTSVIGDNGSVARWGGDEFVVVLPALNEAQAHSWAAAVHEELRLPIRVGTEHHEVGASIGYATYGQGDSVEQLLLAADEAMFEQKQSRRGRSAADPAVLLAVEKALDDDRVEVWFQPFVSGSGAELTLLGAEALVRIRDEQATLLEPASFLADIQDRLVGRDLDRRVIERALGQVSTWIGEGRLPQDFYLGVNCSEALMTDEATPAFIAETLRRVGLEPHNLMMEINERASAVSPTVVSALDNAGVKLALDDLGMDNTNIERLFAGGASVAKIHGRLLQRAAGSNTAANHHVLRHLVSLCDALGLDVVAEGVETPEHFAELQELGVSNFQGYLFTQPLSGADFAGRFLACS